VGIIVTGASGQFGRRAAELLLERVPARELILVTRNPSKLAEFAALRQRAPRRLRRSGLAARGLCRW
jgi:uncharacterized protein YbjT (DUF2867 family)